MKCLNDAKLKLRAFVIAVVIFLIYTSCARGQAGSSGKANWRRFGHYTEIGALATTNTTPDNVTTAAFSFQMVNGYRFKPQVFAGIGIGADLFATETIIPVFGTVRVDFLKKGDFIPFYFLDLGYGINATSNSGIEYSGGLSLASGIGFKINLIDQKGFLVSFGYRFQDAEFIKDNIKEQRDYKRLALRAGFYL